MARYVKRKRDDKVIDIEKETGEQADLVLDAQRVVIVNTGDETAKTEDFYSKQVLSEILDGPQDAKRRRDVAHPSIN